MMVSRGVFKRRESGENEMNGIHFGTIAFRGGRSWFFPEQQRFGVTDGTIKPD